MAADISATLAGLDRLAENFNEATRQIVGDAAHIIQAGGMMHAPVGIMGNTTNMLGDLRRSIMVEGPFPVAEDTWGAKVGPTVVYGRQRELGGALFPKRARFMRYERYGVVEYRKRVYQRPEPYMRPAHDESRDPIWAVTLGRLTAVIEGG